METRVEGFFEARCQELKNEVKVLQFNNAEMEKQCEELSKRVNTLANRQPTWPKGYKPQRRLNSNR